MNKHLLILMVCVLMQGCASTLSLNPQILDGQQKIQQGDTTTVVSSKATLVAIRPSTPIYSSWQRPKLVVGILNATNTSFDVSTDNIKVYVDAVPHKVFSAAELVAEAERQQAQAEMDAMLDDLVYSMRATRRGYWRSAHPYVYDSYGFRHYVYRGFVYRGFAYPSYGCRGCGYGVYGHGYSRSGFDYFGYGKNAVVVPQAQPVVDTPVADAQENMQALISEADQLLTSFGSTMLQKTTVPPQAWYGGYITIAPIPNPELPHEIKVVITAAGEQHEFLLQQVMVEK